ncbi:MAG: ParB/RepB/Spo0J family partition protein [Candidatus Bathyarchaeota archaeon]|nr:ParB/RepB/Spo0J family partition protein [Candidatus Bathyarchaeota archaeon]
MERKEISVSKIEANRFNPNVMSKEEYDVLLQDMKMTGPKHAVAISPISVSPRGTFYNDPNAELGTYVIIDGEHRWRAAKELGWETIPCDIHMLGEDLGKVMSYRRNRERGNIDPLKEAALFKSEVDRGLTHDRIALAYNVERSYVSKRLRLLGLDEKVVDLFTEPEKTYRKAQLERYEERRADWEAKKQELEEEESSRVFWESEPEKPDEGDLVPHGTLTPSHLEAISSLPVESQLEIARHVVDRDTSVRETERLVKMEKEEIAEQKRFQNALAKAERPNCPACGQPAEDFAYGNEKMFKCHRGRCYETWDYMKTRKEAEAEKETQKSASEKRRAEQLRETFREARENPGYIRLPETPEELHEKVKPWLVRKVQQLTEIRKISVRGMRGEEEIRIDYDPPDGYTRMNLAYTIRIPSEGSIAEERSFGFNIEAKDYKKVEAKSRVDMGWGLKASEYSRQALRDFFASIVLTDKDPGDTDETE